MPSLTLDLFADPEPTVTAHIPGFEKMAPETQQALCTMVQAAYDAASRRELQGHTPKRSPITFFWQCGLCSFLNTEHNVSPDKLEMTPVGDWKRRQCSDCGEFQYLARVAEDVGSFESWQYIGTIPPEGQPEPIDELRQLARKAAGLNPHAYAFVAQARKSGHTDPSLTPVHVSPAGRRDFDLDELARFANELLRGVRSTRPIMTPERWGEAIQAVRGGKS